jgi:hypothetical protein
MRFLENERLYSQTEECLEWLRQLGVGGGRQSTEPRQRCHLYWQGEFRRKQAFAVKSFLATQDLDRTELWLWLDSENGRAGNEDNPLLRPLTPYLEVRRFDPCVEAAGTPAEGRSELYEGLNATKRSDFFRHVILFKYGGIYADLDMMFLRDVWELPPSFDEFCYRWSGHVPYANSAFLRLRRGSDVARAILLRCIERGSCRPQDVLRFGEGESLDVLVLPCGVFDPVWLHVDRLDRYRQAPFDRFDGFFRPFGWRFRRKSGVQSHRDFFSGAFAYHWHNLWRAQESPDSYFGLFDREFDAILQERLGIENAGLSARAPRGIIC